MDEEKLKKLIDSAAQEVVKLLDRYDVVFIIPPGSCRYGVVDKTLQLAKGIHVEVLTYRKHGDCKTIERRLKSLIEKKRDGKFVVVTEDTFSAVSIAKNLVNEKLLSREKVVFFDVAEFYGQKLREVGLEPEEYLKLDYGRVKEELESLGISIVPGHNGVSITLVNRGKPEIVNIIKSLSPRSPRLEELAKMLINRFRKRPNHVLLLSIARLSYYIVSETLTTTPWLGPLLRVSLKFTNDTLKSLIKKYKTEPLKTAIEFIQIARELRQYLNESTYEGVFDSIASQWGISISDFKKIIENIAKLAEEELTTKEDIERILKEKEEKLAEMLKKLKRELEEERLRIIKLENQIETLGGLTSALLGVYTSARAYPYVKFKDGKYYIEIGRKEYQLATTIAYEELSTRMLNSLQNKKLVLVYGSPGSGKSTLVHYTVFKLLKDHEDEPMSLYVWVLTSLENQERVRSLIDAVKMLNGTLLIVYDPLPPSIYEKSGFTPHGGSLKDVHAAVESLLGVYSEWRGSGLVSIVIVLPTDAYEYVVEHLSSQELKLLHEEGVVINLDEELKRDAREFVKSMLVSYSGCTNVDEVVNQLCDSYMESLALIAKEAGLLLRRENCDTEHLTNIIIEAGDRVYEYLSTIVYERLGLRGVAPSIRDSLLGKYAVILALRAPFINRTSFSEYIAPPALMSYLMKYAGLDDEKINRNYIWLSMRNEDLVEEIFKGILEDRATIYYLLRELGILSEDIEEPSTNELVNYIVYKYVPLNWGAKIWSTVTDRVDSPDCFRKLLHAVGYTPFKLAPSLRLLDFSIPGIEIKLPVLSRWSSSYDVFSEFVSLKTGRSASSTCEFDELLFPKHLPKREPLFVSGIVLFESLLQGRFKVTTWLVERVNVCKLVNEALNWLRESLFSASARVKEIPESLAPYTLALSLLALESDECGDKAVDLLYFTLLTASGYMMSEERDHIMYSVWSRVQNKLLEQNMVGSYIKLLYLINRITKMYEKDINHIEHVYEEYADMLKPWEKALFITLILEYAERFEYDERLFSMADELINEVRNFDEALFCILRIAYLSKKAELYERSGDRSGLEETKKEIERLSSMVEEITRSRGLSSELKSFLEYVYPREPEVVLRCLLRGYKELHSFKSINFDQCR